MGDVYSAARSRTRPVLASLSDIRFKGIEEKAAAMQRMDVKLIRGGVMGPETFRRPAGYLLIGVLAAVTALATEATSQARRTTVAFVDVTVIDGTGASARPNQTVLVSEDRITDVGPSSSVPIPRAARTINAAGRFLIPGLWDAHVHTRYEGIDHLRLLIANGITSARNMSGPWEYLPEILRWREEITRGVRIGPRLLTAGPVLDGPSAGRSTSVIVHNPNEGRQAVQRVKSAGADFVKVYNLLSRDSFFAIAAEAKALGLPFAGHLPYAVRADEASDAGQLSIEHMDGILWASSDREEEIRRLLQDWDPRPGVPTTPVSAVFLRDSFDEGKVRALADHFKKNQTAVVPTLSVYWNRFERRTEHSVVASDDRLRYVPAAYSERWKQQLRSITSDDDDRLLFEQSLIVVRELHKAGVTILPGTDVGTSFQVPGFSLHDELSLLVRAGLSPMEALEAATRNPARTFSLVDQGTIEAGMRADLVLLDSNPLENIDNVRRIRLVVAAGRVFERNDLDRMLSDVQRAASQWAGTPTR